MSLSGGNYLGIAILLVRKPFKYPNTQKCGSWRNFVNIQLFWVAIGSRVQKFCHETHPASGAGLSYSTLNFSLRWPYPREFTPSGIFFNYSIVTNSPMTSLIYPWLHVISDFSIY